MNARKSIPPTSQADLESALQELRNNADRFARWSIGERIALLEKIHDGVHRVAEASVRAACEAKGLDFTAAVSGEEWLGGPVLVLRNLRLLLKGLRHLQATGSPLLPPLKTLPHGQVAARVFPADLLDSILFAGFEAWVWFDPGVTLEDVAAKAAIAHRTSAPPRGEISLVLGAGNVASIAPMDALYKMFHELKVVIIKMNPVNEYLGPFIEEAFKDAIQEGILRVVYGAGDVGSFLVNHKEVDDIHITGSDETHDLIVWGPPGPDRERRRAENQPRLSKPISSELGNVSPVVVVPGHYSDRELQFQAENVATMLTNNGGFNCNAVKVLLTAEGWAQRKQFVDLLASTLDTIPPRFAYYPGARDRHRQFTEGRKEVRVVGRAGPDALPWAIISGLDPTNRDEICFSKEAFCGILGETSLPGSDGPSFLKAATAFCNDRLWGTLNISIILPRNFRKDEGTRQAFDEAVRDLRYGTIAVNHWAALGYGFVSTPWGGFSGQPLENVQSGRGWVHNAFMLEDIQKAVVTGPLVVSPRPAWFRTNRNTHNIARRLLDFEKKPGFLKLPGLLLEAFRG